MKQIILLFGVLFGLSKSSVGFQGNIQESVTVANGSIVKIICNVTDVSATIWLLGTTDQHDIIIGNGVTVFDKYKNQYQLHEMDQGNSSQLVLTVLEASQDGIYTCQEESNNRAVFHLTVEVPPVVQLMRDGVRVSDEVNVEYTKEIPIQCVAEGGKPLVSLTWQINGRDKTDGVTTDESRVDERIITSTLNYLPNLDDTIVTCITNGQEVIPSISVNTRINVMYAPSCNLLVTNETSNQFRLICKCNGNPAAGDYKILVNGSIYAKEKEALLPSKDTAMVSCSASNVIGTDVTDSQKVKSFHVNQPTPKSQVALVVVLLIVFVVVIILITFIAVYVYKKAHREKAEAQRERDNARAELEALQQSEKRKREQRCIVS